MEIRNVNQKVICKKKKKNHGHSQTNILAWFNIWINVAISKEHTWRSERIEQIY